MGLVSIDQLEKAPRSAWSTITAGELADRDPELILGEHEDVAHLLERARFARVGREAVITSVVDRSGSSRSQTYSAPFAPIVSVILLPAHPTRRMASSASTSGDGD